MKRLMTYFIGLGNLKEQQRICNKILYSYNMQHHNTTIDTIYLRAKYNDKD